MPRRFQKLTRPYLTKKLAGTILIIVAVVGLYGWVNSIEPDCYYSTKVGLQIRLCGENYVGREESEGLWVPAAFFLILGVGVVLRIRTHESTDEQHNPDAD